MTVIIDVSALQVVPFKQIYSFLWNSSCACSGHHLDKILLITCESSFIATGLIRAPWEILLDGDKCRHRICLWSYGSMEFPLLGFWHVSQAQYIVSSLEETSGRMTWVSIYDVDLTRHKKGGEKLLHSLHVIYLFFFFIIAFTIFHYFRQMIILSKRGMKKKKNKWSQFWKQS